MPDRSYKVAFAARILQVPNLNKASEEKSFDAPASTLRVAF
jgi:hypothetical protein